MILAEGAFGAFSIPRFFSLVCAVFSARWWCGETRTHISSENGFGGSENAKHQTDLSWESLFNGKSDLFMRSGRREKDCKIELGTLSLSSLWLTHIRAEARGRQQSKSNRFLSHESVVWQDKTLRRRRLLAVGELFVELLGENFQFTIRLTLALVKVWRNKSWVGGRRRWKCRC